MKPKKEQQVQMKVGDQKGARGEVREVNDERRQATVQFADGSVGDVDFDVLEAAKDKA